MNCVVDLLLPQRTLLAGWLTVLPALYLLLRGLKANNRRLFIALGVWAGAMPMIHTHSFLALGAISLGALAYYACRKERDTVANLVLYGAIACVLALPQLLFWSFPQTFGGGYPRLRFNWVNNTGSGLIDEYFWFWIKNVGPVFIVLVPAALSAGRRGKALALGALILFALAELVQFQENPYDNIKLFYVAYIAVLPLAAQYLLAIYDRLKGIRGRALLAAVFLVLTLTSGAMSLAREAISRYALFSPQDVEAAEFVKDNTSATRCSSPTRITSTPFPCWRAAPWSAGRISICGGTGLRRNLPQGRPTFRKRTPIPASRLWRNTTSIMCISAPRSAATVRMWIGSRKISRWSTIPAAFKSMPCWKNRPQKGARKQPLSRLAPAAPLTQGSLLESATPV